MTGTLYVVGTPIGNLDDITWRAIHTLKTVDLIAAEDTRHTQKLLQHFQINTPQVSYHQHNRAAKTTELIERLQADSNIALVSDAGMPGICDPGAELIAGAIATNINVVPIPGVTAVTTALAAAGLNTDRFVFEGFLPAKGKERKARLQQLQTEARTIVLYEAPHRLQATLADLAAVCGEVRQVVLCRELTKIHEEFWRGSLAEAIELYQQRLAKPARSPKGEYTIVLAGISRGDCAVSKAEIVGELRQLQRTGMSRSEASRKLAQATGLPRRQVYQIALQLEEFDV